MAHYKGAASEAGRAMQLLKKREQAQMEIEFRKKKIEEDLKISNIENKFAAHYDAVEQQLKTSTIGLVTLDEMKAKQENIVKERERKLAQKQAEKEREQQRQLEAKQAEKNRQRKQSEAMSTEDEDSDENETDSFQETLDLRNKRANKNRPQEISSKAFKKKGGRPQASKPVQRIDPRFDSLYGTFEEKTFKSSYSFLEELEKKGKSNLQRLLKKERIPERKKQIQVLLERMANREMAKEKNENHAKSMLEQRSKYVEGLREGKRVPYPKKSNSKMEAILKDFEDLDKKGKLEKYLKKKSKNLSRNPVL